MLDASAAGGQRGWELTTSSDRPPPPSVEHRGRWACALPPPPPLPPENTTAKLVLHLSMHVVSYRKILWKGWCIMEINELAFLFMSPCSVYPLPDGEAIPSGLFYSLVNA